LKIIIKEDHRAPVAIMQVWYKVGSSYEPNGRTGMSHLLEHTVGYATKKYPAQDKLINDNGGDLNAYTSLDYTYYYEILPSTKLAIAFDLEADRMQGILLDEKAFIKEQQVVIEERKVRTEDNPISLTFERFRAAALSASPYRNPVVGWMNDLINLTPEDLKSWYKAWYAPNNAVVVIVGDVQPSKMIVLAQQYFGKIPSVAITSPKPQNKKETLGERRIVVKVPAKIPYLGMGYNVPSLKTVDQKWQAYALEVIMSILSGGTSARLEKNLVRQQGIAAASAYYNLYSQLDYLFTLHGAPGQDHTTKELETAILNQIKILQTQLVGTQELERAKTQLIAKKTYNKDLIENQATELGSLEAVGLSWKESVRYKENIKAITAEQVKLVALKYLISDRLTVAELQPIQS